MQLPQNNGEVVITRAKQEDLDDILRLRVEAAYWLLEKGIRQWNPLSITAEKVQENYEQTELFIAKCDGCAVGSFSVQWSDALIWKERDHSSAGYIHKLVVSRQAQGSDIGKQLLASAESHIRQAGRSLSRLDCMADNERLNRYYVDAGYRFVERMDGKSWSASLYEKPLLVPNG